MAHRQQNLEANKAIEDKKATSEAREKQIVMSVEDAINHAVSPEDQVYPVPGSRDSMGMAPLEVKRQSGDRWTRLRARISKKAG